MKRQVNGGIQVRSDDEAAKKVGELIGEMGCERMALRARKTAALGLLPEQEKRREDPQVTMQRNVTLHVTASMAT